MGSLRYYWSISRESVRLLFLRQFEYPVYLAGWVLIIPLQYITSVLVLKVLVSNFKSIAGWDFADLMFLYGLGAMSHALAMIIFFPLINMDEMLIRGGFDRLLLRPANVLWQYCVQSLNILGLLDLGPAIVLTAIGSSLSGILWSVERFCQIALIVAGATLIRGALYLFLAAAAFWTKRSRPLVIGGFMLLDRTTNYPLDIYPRFVQSTFTFLVPIAFISYLPAAEFLKKPSTLFPFGAIWCLTPCIGVVVFVAAYLFYRRGLTRYEGAGS